MKMTPRTAGALAALGGLVFVVSTTGLIRFESLVGGLVDVSLPRMTIDCCGCFGVGAFAVPLALLAITLLRKPDASPPG